MTAVFDWLTIGAVLDHRAAADPDRVFLTYHDPLKEAAGRSVDYARCAAEVAELRAVLSDVGVGAGDRVVLRMDNSIEFVVAFLAVATMGAVAVPTIVQYSADELGYVIDHSRCVAVITDARHRPLVDEVIRGGGRPVPVVCDGSVIGRPTTVTTEPLDIGPTMPPGARTALLMYTTGTTARPKGVMLSHAACLAAAHTGRSEIGLRPDDRSYCVLPLFHVNAMYFQLMPALLTGSQVVLGPVFSARAYWPVVSEFGVTVGNLTAGPLRILLDAPVSETDRDHSMRLMTYALPLERDEIMALRSRFGVELSMGWGLTESAACGTRTPLHLDPRHDWQSIGMVSAGWDLRVVDDAGQEVPTGNVGELLVKGPSVMTGYFRDPAATSEALDGGYLRTGDLGRLDQDGYVFFHDRKKDMIKVKGENVAAGEVERVVRELPAVDDCAAVGVPDPILGERLVVFVVGVTKPDLEAIRQHCARRLASFKTPSEVVAVPELPRTSIGKIRKAELRARYLPT